MERKTLVRNMGLARWVLAVVGLGVAGCELLLPHAWDEFKSRPDGVGGGAGSGSTGSTGSVGAGGSCQGLGGSAGMGPSCVGGGGGLINCTNKVRDCCDSPRVDAGKVEFCNWNICEFYLDAFEVTVARFKVFLEAQDGYQSYYDAAQKAADGGVSDWEPKDMLIGRVSNTNAHCTYSMDEQMPINCVKWVEANAFCNWDGGRLPTLAEFKRAANGESSTNTYPWGGADPELCSCAIYKNNMDPSKVGLTTEGRTNFGQFDLAGNVAEWTASDCDPFAGAPSGAVSIFGGAFNSALASLRNDAMTPMVSPSSFAAEVGFRCARPAP